MRGCEGQHGVVTLAGSVCLCEASRVAVAVGGSGNNREAVRGKERPSAGGVVVGQVAGGVVVTTGKAGGWLGWWPWVAL